jgi:RNA polymerase sigma-70 factor (ECF subfamily)
MSTDTADDFDSFYRDTSRRLLRYAYGLTGDAEDARNLTQEAYARAWQRWRHVSSYDEPEAWLRVVVSRLSTDRLRRLRVHRARGSSVAQEATVPPPSEDTVVLVKAMRSLPPNQRNALVLYYMLDRSVGDIAAEAGVSAGTVKSWLSRGRAGLAVALGAGDSPTERERDCRVGERG